MSEDYSQRSFEFEGVRYQMVKTEKGTHMCDVCEASGPACTNTIDGTVRKPCGNLETRDGWHYVKVKAKLPEPPAPKSLSLDEIMDDQEAKPSEDLSPTQREKLETTGWSGAFDPVPTEYTAARVRESQENTIPKHDGHYRTLEAKGAEPIERMEALVCRGIPEDLHRIAKRNLNMAMASKHQDRAGEKSGEAWEKELQKAENYLHRAWSGRWI